MKIEISDDPRACGYNAVSDVATILRSDADWIKELVGNIKKTTDTTVIRRAERDFHSAMVDQYGSTVAGELLSRLWMAARKSR